MDQTWRIGCLLVDDSCTTARIIGAKTSGPLLLAAWFNSPPLLLQDSRILGGVLVHHDKSNVSSFAIYQINHLKSQTSEITALL